MAQKALFSRLGNNPKQQFANIAIILIIVVVVIVVFYYLIYPNVKVWFRNLKASKNVNDEVAKGGTLSYDNSKFETLANSLYRAMKGAGTDTSAVYAVFNQMNTKADVLKLIQAFGVRDNENLQEWMRGEWKLSITKINNILNSKGIDYIF
jgi:predicted PurR-regulated permease PerM